MRSFRKMGLLVAAFVAVMAVSLPGVANATSLTYGGKPVAVGSKFSAATISSFHFKNTIAGSGFCGEMTLPALLMKNSGGLVEASGVGLGTAQPCYLNGKGTSIQNLELRKMRFESPKVAKMGLAFDMWVLGENCRFEREDISTTYSPGGNSFNVPGYTSMNATPKWCGPLTIEADFSLKDTSGNPLILN